MVRLGQGATIIKFDCTLCDVNPIAIVVTLKKTYANATDTSIVSSQLDVYGYTYFMSPIVALFPGFLSFFVLKLRKNEYFSNLYTGKFNIKEKIGDNLTQVCALMIITSIIGSINSFQMTLQDRLSNKDFVTKCK